MPSQHVEAVQDPALLDAAAAILGDAGWEGLMLELVAQRAGVSRATAWRRGIRKETLLAGLLERLGADYRESMWRVLTMPGSGRERIEAAMRTICDVADRHLDVLLASDHVFHRAFHVEHTTSSRPDFVGPLARILGEGAADGSLRTVDNVMQRAELLFNALCWPYVHLRARHGWPTRRAQDFLIDLLVGGLVE